MVWNCERLNNANAESLSELNADSGQAQVQCGINNSVIYVSLTGCPLCTPLTMGMINQVVKPAMFIVNWEKSAPFIFLQTIFQIKHSTMYTVIHQNDKTFPSIVKD